MGNNPTKEARATAQPEPRPTADITTPSSSSTHRPSASTVQSSGNAENGRRRGGSRHEISLFRIGGGAHHEPDPSDPSARRETRAEREARKREKERELRAIERERSMKEEGVDGGYLVTLGTYTGPEDFSKTVVRQLMVERRLAPFWKGLQDHEDSWADNQLVALARGEPMPEPGPAPTPEQLGASTAGKSSPERTHSHGNSLTVPSYTPGERPRSPSNPEHSSSNLFGSPPSSFRTRARTLVSLSTPRNNSQSDMTPTEVMLPKDPYVNGQPMEAFLYKNASECPICFLYYPPYLNKTRCCDQPICSECFVQIKRPDPHPPEHHDDPNNPNPPPAPETDYELVSEVATCPFCKQPEFGVTYESPPFRRGLVYNEHHRVGNVMSAMSSSSSVNSQSPSAGSRRRATSLAADAPNVITTDIVRPDWRKKLDDARAHALRRAAAATALHNAAYMLGNQGEGGPRISPFGRRRRTFFGDVGGNDVASGRSGGELGGLGHMSALLAAADRQSSTGGQQGGDPSSNNDLYPGRGSSRRSRMEDLEELMYMEAIRLSLASAEEERKKQEKEEAKKAKKEEKQKAKDAKKAAKDAKRRGSASMYSASINESQASGFNNGAGESSSMGRARSSSGGQGKGKAPAGSATPSPEPPTSKTPKEDPQAFLEQSRANIQSAPVPVPSPNIAAAQQTGSTPPHRQVMRHLSSASSVSSLNEGDSQDTSPNASGLHLDAPSSTAAATAGTQGPYSETPPSTEPMFNFRSLAAVIGSEEDSDGHAKASPMIEHLENAPTPSPEPSPLAEGSSGSPPKSGMATPPERPLSAGERLFGTMSPLPGEVNKGRNDSGRGGEDGGEVGRQESNPYDAKHYGDISVLDASFPSSMTR